MSDSRKKHNTFDDNNIRKGINKINRKKSRKISKDFIRQLSNYRDFEPVCNGILKEEETDLDDFIGIT